MTVRDAVDTSSAATLAAGSTSFAAAARLFDAATRRDAQLLYAWCRHCDDVIDGQVLGHGDIASDEPAHVRLQRLDALTRAVLRGESVSDPAFVAFGRVALKHSMPARYPLDLIEGFRMDVEGRNYVTLDDTLSYSYHVAGVVGLMMALIMGVQPGDEATLDRACDLGLAFQLTNIARDVIEDFARGRVYLPGEWLRQAGVPADAVADPALRPRVHGVAVRLLDTADLYYASSSQGLARLPRRAAMAIGGARAVYRGIGTRLRNGGPAAWDRRVALPRHRKLALLAQGGVLGMLAVRPEAGGRRDDLWIRPRTGPA